MSQSPIETLDRKHEQILRHMLGAGSHTPRRNHGYRNRFCAEVGSEDHKTLEEMEKAGLVEAGGFINEGRDRYYRATLAGCRAIGLHKAAVKRAFAE